MTLFYHNNTQPSEKPLQTGTTTMFPPNNPVKISIFNMCAEHTTLINLNLQHNLRPMIILRLNLLVQTGYKIKSLTNISVIINILMRTITRKLWLGSLNLWYLPRQHNLFFHKSYNLQETSKYTILNYLILTFPITIYNTNINLGGYIITKATHTYAWNHLPCCTTWPDNLYIVPRINDIIVYDSFFCSGVPWPLWPPLIWYADFKLSYWSLLLMCWNLFQEPHLTVWRTQYLCCKFVCSGSYWLFSFIIVILLNIFYSFNFFINHYSHIIYFS